jgi:Family of unknown function (DUF6527)
VSDLPVPAHVEHGNMVRDPRDEWPDNEPVASFDIDRCTLLSRPGVTAHILFVCPLGKRCGVFLGPVAEGRQEQNPGWKGCVWGWDGNLEKPTLTPSINCIAEKDGKPTGGCGAHFCITAGVMK